nr:MAG TPA: hypothetical protein [Caudoviricetes sp.]
MTGGGEVFADQAVSLYSKLTLRSFSCSIYTDMSRGVLHKADRKRILMFMH